MATKLRIMEEWDQVPILPKYLTLGNGNKCRPRGWMEGRRKREPS